MNFLQYGSLPREIAFLAENQKVRTPEYGISEKAKRVKYPIRLLRYWFGYQLLRAESRRQGRPLEVVEIGVHLGQMLEFVRSAPGGGIGYSGWTAVDAVLHGERLASAGYTAMIEGNLEDESLRIPGGYDCAILLHVLEHLHEPEKVFARIVESVNPGGVLIGGFPVVPGLVAGIHEKRIRRTAAPLGHVSVFSPGRVKRMAKANGLSLELMSGAFFMRSNGSRLENSAEWMRFNLLWGRTFPGWPGEIYWMMRRPC